MIFNIIGIGSDHAGFDYKKTLLAALENKGCTVKDFGTHAATSVDYPDYVHPLARSLEKQEIEVGILICGSANGVAMTANKYQNIRAAICWQTEIVTLARQHNNANVICIPARFVSLDLASKMVDAFLETAFEGGRHARRVDKISCC